MKIKGILGLTLCLGLLVAFVIYDHYQDTQAEETKLLSSRLIDLELDQVASFSVKNRVGEVELRQNATGWDIIKPLHEAADPVDIRQMILTVLSERIIEVAREGQEIDWSLYGLHEPMGSITITDKNGKNIKLSVGALPNFESNLYLRLNDENRVLVVQGSWAGHVEMTLKDFRDKRVFKGDLAQLTEFKVKNKSGIVELKYIDGKWTSVGTRGELDANKVRDILAKLRSLLAKDILGVEPKTGDFVAEIEAKSEKSAYKLVMRRSADGKIIGKATDDTKIYQMDEGLVGHFEDLTIELLKPTAQSPSSEKENTNEN